MVIDPTPNLFLHTPSSTSIGFLARPLRARDVSHRGVVAPNLRGDVRPSSQRSERQGQAGGGAASSVSGTGRSPGRSSVPRHVLWTLTRCRSARGLEERPAREVGGGTASGGKASALAGG
jgi:hypothetical protein